MSRNPRTNAEPIWLALNIGNSRLHWAWFLGDSLQSAWHTPHLNEAESHCLQEITSWGQRCLPAALLEQLSCKPEAPPELWVASVVSAQAALWQDYPEVKMITLEQVPLQHTYPTLGVDRALAVWGAGVIQGWPVLVIDAGTALTFTGAEADHRLVGGAILPGLGLSVRSLAQSTAALPRIELPHTLPSRWAITTAEAITSGIVYTTLAGTIDFIEAWWQEFPEGWIVLTGGDHAVLFNYLTAWSTRTACSPDWMARLIRDPHLIFWGLRSLRQLACA